MSAQEGPTFGPQHRQESLSLRSAHSVCPATKAQGGLSGEPPGYSPRPRSCHCIAHRCACMPRRRAEGRARRLPGGGEVGGVRGRGAQGPGGRELGVTGSVLQEDHQLCLSELAPKAWKGRVGVCLPPPRPPAPRVGERTLLGLAAPRRAPAGPIPAPPLSLLVPGRPAGRGTAPHPDRPVLTLGFPVLSSQITGRSLNWETGRGGGREAGRGLWGGQTRRSGGLRRPLLPTRSRPCPRAPHGGAHAARRHRVPGQRPAVPAPSLLAPPVPSQWASDSAAASQAEGTSRWPLTATRPPHAGSGWPVGPV